MLLRRIKCLKCTLLQRSYCLSCTKSLACSLSSAKPADTARKNGGLLHEDVCAAHLLYRSIIDDSLSQVADGVQPSSSSFDVLEWKTTVHITVTRFRFGSDRPSCIKSLASSLSSGNAALSARETVSVLEPQTSAFISPDLLFTPTVQIWTRLTTEFGNAAAGLQHESWWRRRLKQDLTDDMAWVKASSTTRLRNVARANFSFDNFVYHVWNKLVLLR